MPSKLPVVLRIDVVWGRWDMADLERAPSAAVLLSGGLDSAVLAIELLKNYRKVHPIYVRFGLRWEAAELFGLKRFLAAVSPGKAGLKDLVILDEPIQEVYGEHWSNEGREGVPDYSSRDEAVYLPGRNVLLATKASVWCRLREVETLAFGTLKGNPFPDSGPEFFDEIQRVLNRAMEGRLRIVRPFERMSKLEVARQGVGLPLELTFSCLDPRERRHCGACNKCAERQKVFRDAGLIDQTDYAEMSAIGRERSIREA